MNRYRKSYHRMFGVPRRLARTFVFALTITVFYMVRNERCLMLHTSAGRIMGKSHIQLWTSNKAREYENGFTNLTEPDFLSYLSSRWILQPGTSTYNLTRPEKTHFSQDGQSEYVDELLEMRTGGFFVDCGAARGEPLSNTLFLERERGWNGMLIEANPYLFQEMLTKNRRAYQVNACLSPNNSTARLQFTMNNELGGLDPHAHKTNKKIKNKGGSKSSVQCFPLYPLLLAVGHTRIDYFSLDVEGSELPILRTIPWHALYIDVIGVEYKVYRGTAKQHNERLEQYRELFRSLNGMYKEVKQFDLDVFFKHT